MPILNRNEENSDKKENKKTQRKQCDECGLWISRHSFKRHKENMHKNCQKCDKLLKGEGEDENTKHSQNCIERSKKARACDKCGQEFQGIYKLKRLQNCSFLKE